VSALSDHQRTLLRRDRVGFVFQAFNLIPSVSALENITLPVTLAGRKPDPAWLDELVTTLGLGDRLAHTPAELSGGQQQRVAVARAIVTNPAVLLADEPTGNLDSVTSIEIMDLLTALNRDGITVLMVTHEPDMAEYARTIVHFRDGVIERVDEKVPA
jgi:putative ABC transport system ATP-binding protein